MPFRTPFLFLMCLGLAGLSSAACGGDDSEIIDSANQTAAALDDEDEANSEESPGDDSENGGGSVSAFDLREGDCFNTGADNTVNEVELVDCAAAHEYEVTDLFAVPDAEEFPGDAYFGDQALDNCDEGSVTYLAPSGDTWDAGDRVVICLAEG